MYDFEKLCLPCYQELVAYATKRTRNKTQAEDIVQESYAKALSAWERWEPQGDVKTYARAWMFRIVSNLFALQYQRDKVFTRITSEPAECGMIAGELHQKPVTEHVYQHVDTLGDEVREAMERIKPEWADVVKLVYVEGVPAHDVAKILKIAPGTVRSRMARGRLALARILSPYARQRFGFKVKPEKDQVDHVAEELLGGADETLTSFEATELPQAQSYGI